MRYNVTKVFYIFKFFAKNLIKEEKRLWAFERKLQVTPEFFK